MNIRSLTSRTVSFELENTTPYYTEEFNIYLDDKFYKKENKNVFTLFDLEPDTVYKVRVDDAEITFKTKDEIMTIHTDLFNPAKDGITNDTLKIQAAIMACPEGGCVYIDKGTYVITSLFLKSNITLYLDKDAKLLGEYDRNLFPVLPSVIKNSTSNLEINYGTWEGSMKDLFAGFITAINCNNVVVAGLGEIDARAKLGDWYQNHNEIRIAARPFGIFFNNCRNIEVIGIHIHDTPSWNVHPYMSTDLKFINMRIENPVNMPTTDGLDPDCCNNVLILGVYFNVGDDCIAIKSGTYEFAKKHHVPCQNITVRNCLMNAGHGGVVFGSESSGGILNVTVSHCYFNHTDRGLRIKTRRGRGRVGIIDKVKFENIYMNNVLTPFVINMFYNMGPKGGHEEYVWTLEKQEVTELTPKIGSFTFSNITCDNVELAGGVFLGLPEEPIEGVIFKNVTFNYKEDAVAGYPVMIEHKEEMLKRGIYALNVKDVKLENVTFNGNLGDEVTKI